MRTESSDRKLRRGTNGAPPAQNGQGTRLVVALGLCGVASGIITCAFIYPQDNANGISPGVIFGISLAVPLTFLRIVDLLKALLLVVYSAAIYVIAIVTAIFVQMKYPQLVPEADLWNMGNGETPALIPLFIGGFIGGLLLFAVVTYASGISARWCMANALVGAVLGGVLGLAGWALGGSLGVVLWHFLDIFHLASGGSPRICYDDGCYYTELAHTYSLFMVWQTGVAVAMGWMLRSVAVAVRPENASHASRSGPGSRSGVVTTLFGKPHNWSQ